MTRLNWRSAASQSADKWAHIARLAEAENRDEFSKAILGQCSMCSMATQEIESLGPPKVELKTCDFCRGYLDFGGCQEPLHDIMSALERSDWNAVRARVAQVRGAIAELLASQ